MPVLLLFWVSLSQHVAGRQVVQQTTALSKSLLLVLCLQH
jgi:hypothetical protein